MKIDNSRDANITDFGKAVLEDRYLQNGETYQDLFARVSKAYSNNKEHAQRLYDYMSNMWFMPATPILANGGTTRGLPISCFLNETEDSLNSIAQLWNENVYLASSGGGIGSFIGNIRSINEEITGKGHTSGVIPFIKVIDSMTLAISQGSLRRGSAAVYMNDTHPEIEEFIDIRRPTGGDTNRRCLNIHHGVCLSDEFMKAVQNGTPWELKSPATGKVVNTINPRDLWIKILTTRVETGEPYILYTGNANRNISDVYKKSQEIYAEKGLHTKTSNLCVAPETLILTPDGWQDIKSCANQKTTIWNGFEWSDVIPRKTGENSKLMHITVTKNFNTNHLSLDSAFKTGEINGLVEESVDIFCTEHHKWYIKPTGLLSAYKKPICKSTFELKEGDIIISYSLPHKYYHCKAEKTTYKKVNFPVESEIVGVFYTNKISDTYCFTEPKRNMAVFNGILTGNCNEIMLHTGKDYLEQERTAVCCLSSLNLAYYEEWKHDATFIEDIMNFLDNVLQDFIDRAPDSMARAKYSAMRERSVGLGVMGFHSFLQSKMTPIEGVAAKSWNKQIFAHIKEKCDAASKKIAQEKGACLDAKELGIEVRFSNCTAIAPTASISIICGNSSPGIEPFLANCYTHKTLSGSFIVRNKHLKKLLQEKGKDTDNVWSSIAMNEGSVQHLDCLTPEEKDVFKTAMEVNQMWLIDHASDRQPFIDQGQSLNVFIASNVEKKNLNVIHFQAWKKGIKGLYYCRSASIQRAEKVPDKNENLEIPTTPLEEEAGIGGLKNVDECIGCQ